MDKIIVFVCFLLSAIVPQALYFIFPVLLLYTIWLQESLSINRLTKIYISISLVVLFFLIIQVLYYQSIEFIYLKGTLRYFAYAAFALYLAKLSEKDISIIFILISLFILLTLPLTLYQLILFERGSNIFMHANHFAYVLVICIVFLLKTKGSFIKPILYLILLASLIMAKTTGAILSLLIILFHEYHVKIKSIYIKIPMISFALLFLIVGFSYSDKIIEQISSLQYLDWGFIKVKALTAQPGGYGSFMWRIIYWTQILFAFFDNNFIVILIGEGIDSLTKSNRDIYSFLYTDPHNDFIKILVEYGILGFSFFILLLYRFSSFLGKRMDILFILVIPFFFDNMIVNWSYNIVFLLYLTYFYKAYISRR
ncbi:MAG: hypothetical protein VX762_02130 [Bacteroidota bacterium]|nr:hypothetical protein [Bacteroidota bacterium]